MKMLKAHMGMLYPRIIDNCYRLLYRLPCSSPNQNVGKDYRGYYVLGKISKLANANKNLEIWLRLLHPRNIED